MIKITGKDEIVTGNRAEDFQAVLAAAIHRLRGRTELDPACLAIVIVAYFFRYLDIIDAA